ncbi:MAG: DUF5053 domain-containing protein [Bacteroides sp.]|nr:DUF5053 domain-containing protein [Bacteroides sp.]
MDVKKELDKWMEEYRQCNTPEESASHQERFNAFINSLNQEDGRAFALEFAARRKKTIREVREINETLLKQQLENVKDMISLAYIAKHYFGKSKQWLYQRINGNSINGKPVSLTSDELLTLKNALLDISGKLQDTSRSLA